MYFFNRYFILYKIIKLELKLIFNIKEKKTNEYNR
jgi:hypothetical protein